MLMEESAPMLRISSLRKHTTLAVCALSLSLSIVAVPAAVADVQTPRAAVNTAAPAAINSTEDVVQWMTYYYLHPQPDLLVPALQYADANGLIEKGQAPLTAFVSRVFAQNPARIAGWTKELESLSPQGKPLLWSALWWSNTVEGKQSLEELMKTLTEKQAGEVLQQMAHPATPIEQLEVKTPEVLDELWGAYSATGDEKYVNRLISVLPWQYDHSADYMRMTIGSAARWSLTSNAQQHPAVLKICLKARDAQPQLKGILDKIITDATKGTGAAGPSTNQTGQSSHSL
jgi:hypothetical protein